MKLLSGAVRAVFRAGRSSLPFAVEASMACLSARAAWILLTNQLYFDEQPAAYGWLVEHVTRHEWVMGALAGVAAVLKAAGLLLLPVRADGVSELVFALRQFGWTASTVFWCLVGTSILVGAPGTLGSANTIELGIIAAIVMLSGPTPLAEARDGRAR